MQATRLISLFPKTFTVYFEQYSKRNISEDQFKSAALDEANKMGFGKSHKIKKFFLNTLLFGTRTIGYSATAVVGASALPPAFLAFDMMFSRVNPHLKALYAYSLVFGATGLGLTSYYIGIATHKIAKLISEKIRLIEYIERTDPETAVNSLFSSIEFSK